MHSCIIPEWSKIKKSLKKNPFEGRDYLRMKTIELQDTEPYSRKEIIQNEMNHLGSVNIETVIPPRFSEVFKEKNFKPINEFDDPRDVRLKRLNMNPELLPKPCLVIQSFNQISPSVQHIRHPTINSARGQNTHIHHRAISTFSPSY